MYHPALDFFGRLAFVAFLSFSGGAFVIESMMVLLKALWLPNSSGDCMANPGGGPRSGGTYCLQTATKWLAGDGYCAMLLPIEKGGFP